MNAELLNSAARAWASRKAEARTKSTSRYIFDPEEISGALNRVIAGKLARYQAEHPAMPLKSPNPASVRSRVLRYETAPDVHDISVGDHGRGPKPLLADAELVLLNLVEEMAEGGLYMDGNQLCARMAAIIDNTPAGNAFAELAAKSRGEKDAAGELVYKPQDLLPGPKWKRNFLARYAERLTSTLPVALDKTRELWQTVDNFAFWYLSLERFLVKHDFAAVAPEYAPLVFCGVDAPTTPDIPYLRNRPDTWTKQPMKH